MTTKKKKGFFVLSAIAGLRCLLRDLMKTNSSEEAQEELENYVSHKFEIVEYQTKGGYIEKVEIDTEILPLIRLLWDLDIHTVASCQGGSSTNPCFVYYGTEDNYSDYNAYILFENKDDFVKFITILHTSPLYAEMVDYNDSFEVSHAIRKNCYTLFSKIECDDVDSFRTAYRFHPKYIKIFEKVFIKQKEIEKEKCCAQTTT